MTPGVVAVLATLDTKAAEAAFLDNELRRHGCRPRVVDVGLRPYAREPGAAYAPAEAVAAHAGYDLEQLRESSRRDEAMRAMGAGAARVLDQWHAAGELAGVLGIGGNQGTAIAATAIRDLPFRVPKLIVSTVASGNVRGYVGDSDIILMFSVGDLLGGPNPVTTRILSRGAAALAGMTAVEDRAPTSPERTALVAVTAFGNTHGAVTSAIERLEQSGAGAVPFHASGASGSAMERLIDEGMFDGVLDLTTHELLAELYPADIYAPVRPGRLTAAGRGGLPQVVAPGGLDYHCFAAAETIPEHLRTRRTHYHNPNNTNVRANAAELTTAARVMAERLNAATGPVTVVIPLRGWSEIGSPGGALYDQEANDAFLAELRSTLSPRVVCHELDCTINASTFGTRAADTLLDALELSSPSGPEQLGAASRVH